MVFDPHLKSSHIPWTTLSQFEPDESWECHLAICLWHGKRKLHWWKNLVIQYRYSQVVSWPNFLAHNVTELKKPQIIIVAPQAFTAGARYDGRITSSAAPITVEQDSLDHVTFSLYSWVQSLWSLMSGLLQLFSPNTLSSLYIVCMEISSLSLLNMAVSSTVDFLWFDFTKYLRKCQSWLYKFFPNPFLPRR